MRAYLYQNMDYRDQDRMISIGSISLYALGIRRNADIDSFIVNAKNENKSLLLDLEKNFMADTKFSFADIGALKSSYWKPQWTEKNNQWFQNIQNGPRNMMEFATNPAHHFYFQGMKVGVVEYEIVKKLLRGEGHDVFDLFYINHVLDKTIFNHNAYYDIKSDEEISNLKSFDDILIRNFFKRF